MLMFINSTKIVDYYILNWGNANPQLWKSGRWGNLTVEKIPHCYLKI
jgi:hypothetical protein